MTHDPKAHLDDDGFRWSPDDLEAMRTLRAEGLTRHEVALRLGRTYDAVVKKLDRLGPENFPKG